MQRLLLMAALGMFGCATVTTAAGPEANEANEPDAQEIASEPGANIDEDDDESPAGLTLDEETLGEDARFHGKLANVRTPATFRMRTELGCSHDVTLETTTRGNAFTVAMTTDEVADAFGCLIDVESDSPLPFITVTPSATVSSADALVLDPSFMIVGAELAPSTATLVRFMVDASAAPNGVARASLHFGESSYGATLAPSEEGSTVATTAVFDVPAREWASASVSGATATIDIEDLDGSHLAMTLHPTARLEAPVEDCN